MRYLLGIVLMICGAIGMSAQEFMPLPVLDHKAEAVNDELYPAETVSVMSTATQGQTEGSLHMTTVFDYKQTKEWKYYKILRAVGWSALGVGVPLFWGCLFGCLHEGWSNRNYDLSKFLYGLTWTGRTYCCEYPYLDMCLPLPLFGQTYVGRRLYNQHTDT